MSHKYATVPFLNAEPAWLNGFDVVTLWYTQSSPNMPTLWLIEQGDLSASKETEVTDRGGQVHDDNNAINQYLQGYERES